MPRLPDFIIIGSQRCGTTSLYAMIAQHPDASACDAGVLAETCYFVNNRRYKRGDKWYANRFNARTKVVGEKSPVYLQHYLAPRRIKRTCPAAKFIVMLRDPVDRAYSNYQKAHAKGFVNGSFRYAIKEEMEGKALEQYKDFWLTDFWGSAHHLLGFLERGHYAEQLQRWFEFFPREQFLIVKSEQFFGLPGVVVSYDVHKFLGLDRFASRNQHKQKLDYPEMSDDMRKFLSGYYKDRNAELDKLLGWEISHGWE